MHVRTRESVSSMLARAVVLQCEMRSFRSSGAAERRLEARRWEQQRRPAEGTTHDLLVCLRQQVSMRLRRAHSVCPQEALPHCDCDSIRRACTRCEQPCSYSNCDPAPLQRLCKARRQAGLATAARWPALASSDAPTAAELLQARFGASANLALFYELGGGAPHHARLARTRSHG